MFCYQCEETNKGEGCKINGLCGKNEEVANLQDLLLYVLKGLSVCNLEAKKIGTQNEKVDKFIIEGLFSTVTNTNFDKIYFQNKINEALELRNEIKNNIDFDWNHDSVLWDPINVKDYHKKSREVGILDNDNEDIRSLRELLIYGIKGMAAYVYHAYELGKEDKSIYDFVQEGLAATIKDLSIDDLTDFVLKCGEYGVKTMALLDNANTSSYGHPEPTDVNIGVRNNPGILISGHDLKDLEEILNQTEGTGIDVYTHGEMLPANAYAYFKKYRHFIGNYGNAWWKQKDEFEKFNGPILLTSNCLVPPKESYKNRVYITGAVGFDGLKYIPERTVDGKKDFESIINHAKKCKSPEKIEDGNITIGFAHNTLINSTEKILNSINSGKIKQFVVMAGCDGRHKEREYYTEFAKKLPNDFVILTAGCAKYRYNKLKLGDINGIPRVIDAGQCNDSYSLVVIAKKLSEILKVGINDLPIIYNIAWYEQKAVLVLLALLSIGIKNIILGPKLPAFISKNVLNILVENFNLMPNTAVDDDLKNLKLIA